MKIFVDAGFLNDRWKPKAKEFLKTLVNFVIA